MSRRYRLLYNEPKDKEELKYNAFAYNRVDS